jgi:UV radiation resistance-associated gene protein
VRRQNKWTLFIEDEADLRRLSYIQVMLGNHFPPNTIVFHLTDGAYAFGMKRKDIAPKGGETLPTASFSSLMKMVNLGNSTQDALESSEKLIRQIESGNKDTEDASLHEAEERVTVVQASRDQQLRVVKATRKRRDELVASIRARRAYITEGRTLQSKASKDVDHAAAKLPASRTLVEDAQNGLRGQRRRICEDLISIFPITQTPGTTALNFQICGLPLPNSEHSLATGHQGVEETISAALGLVGLVVNALQYYLGVLLPYEITWLGSRSTIKDEISLLADPNRVYPLYLQRGNSSQHYRFDYGWFLLNKDIERLCAAQGLKVVDIRHTLPNLKYLLYVCSAGTDELPGRKKGGIRGLWAGKMQGRGLQLGLPMDDTVSTGGSAAGSRRGSADSELLGRQAEQLRKVVAANGIVGGGSADVLEPMSPPGGLPFDEEDTKLTLRTKGLRENVGK